MGQVLQRAGSRVYLSIFNRGYAHFLHFNSSSVDTRVRDGCLSCDVVDPSSLRGIFGAGLKFFASILEPKSSTTQSITPLITARTGNFRNPYTHCTKSYNYLNTGKQGPSSVGLHQKPNFRLLYLHSVFSFASRLNFASFFVFEIS